MAAFLMRGLALALLLFGVVAAPGALFAETAARPRIVMLTHGAATDPFWRTVLDGAEEAARRYEADFQYRAPPTFDIEALAALIDQTVAERPDGIAVALADPDALTPAIRRAVAAGIPLVTLNSGSDVALAIGSRLHVGQDEYDAGAAAGERLRSLGATKAFCVNHEVGNISLDLRCKGFVDGFRGAVEVVAVAGDPAEAAALIEERLSGAPDVDAVIGLGAAAGGEAALQAVARLNLGAKVRVATFDMSDRVRAAIRDGSLAFAIDQQPFLQGYLPVAFLALHRRHGAMPSGPVASGPSLIDRSNIDAPGAGEPG